MNEPTPTMPIKIALAGAVGRMGRETVKAIAADPSLKLVGAVGRRGSEFVGSDVGSICTGLQNGIILQDDLAALLSSCEVDVLIDFTVPGVAYHNACIALKSGVRPIIGATGITEEQMQSLSQMVEDSSGSCLIAPNFALGVLLLIESAKLFAKYFDRVEIIEYHHDKKLDAPSGTAIKTAHELARVKPPSVASDGQNPHRGETVEGIPVHSVRLPGLLAHQEIVFGGVGQSITLRHDALDRSAYMPGVLLAAKKILSCRGLMYGLEELISL